MKRKYYIAIDVDGVIANQIDGILPIIEKQYNVKLTYNDVKRWDLPIKDTNITNIIVNEQKHKKYIVGMPPVENAAKVIGNLCKLYYIAIATARPNVTDTWTKEWLSNNRIAYDDYYNLKEGEKHNAGTDFDILIDDYTKNIFNFLEKGEGKAIIFKQPWNEDLSELQKYIDNERLKVVKSWNEIPNKIKGMVP